MITWRLEVCNLVRRYIQLLLQVGSKITKCKLRFGLLVSGRCRMLRMPLNWTFLLRSDVVWTIDDFRLLAYYLLSLKWMLWVLILVSIAILILDNFNNLGLRWWTDWLAGHYLLVWQLNILIPDDVWVLTFLLLSAFLLWDARFSNLFILSSCIEFYALRTFEDSNFVLELHNLNLMVFISFLNVISWLRKGLSCIYFFFLIIAMNIPIFNWRAHLLHQNFNFFLVSSIFLLDFIVQKLLLNKGSLLLSVVWTFIAGMSRLSRRIWMSRLILLLFNVATIFLLLRIVQGISSIFLCIV